jgi:hypothetical protein
MLGQNRNGGRKRTMRLKLEFETFLLEFKNSQIVLFHQIDDGSDVF